MTKTARQILDYFAETHSGYLHARGKLATNTIIEILDCKADENILELGCGTGATLVELASKYNTSNFHGLEASETMLKFASKRLRFCGLCKSVQLGLTENKLEIPFKDNTFDKIYAESILAIQEGNDLKKLLLECRRVLKPNGILLFNETIWLDSTERKIAEKINSACKLSFGIIQSNSKYLNLKDWKKLICEISLIPQVEISVSEIKETRKLKIPSLSIFLSEVYSLNGLIKAKFNTNLQQEWKQYQQEMKKILNYNVPLMEGVIIKSCNNK